MQYVNDDMDELFRRAAENYPLDTSSANWNKVLAGLQDQNINKTIPEKKRNNGRFLWLLLLLPLGLVCNQFYTHGDLAGHSSSKLNLPKETSSSETLPIPEKNSASNATQLLKINENLETASSTNSVSQATQPTNKYGSKDGRSQTSTKTVGSYFISKKQSSSGLFNANANTVYVSDPTNEELLFGKNYISYISYRELQQPASVVPGRSLIPSINTTNVKTTSTIQVAKRKKFYVGLMGGVDATTRKFQKVEDAGFNFGLLLGYQFNKKWSIESGAYLERKYYYSDGKYFNTSKLYMPANSRIEDLSGNCKMIEVPVAAKYNFATRKQSTWFGVFGLTSYFMLQENYRYNYYYGSNGPIPHNKEYKDGSMHIFSNLSISGGYTHRLGNFADLRIEPYLKLPLSGMGVGSLPLFSTGLQVGVTRKF